MTWRRGQALVELAVTMPVLLLLVFGGAALARLADARAGLDAATAAALSEAVRAPDPAAAEAAGGLRFGALVAPYPLDAPSLALDLGDFRRGATATAVASASVDLAFAPVPGIPRKVVLHSSASARIEPWRSRSAPAVGPSPEYFPSPCPTKCPPPVV